MGRTPSSAPAPRSGMWLERSPMRRRRNGLMNYAGTHAGRFAALTWNRPWSSLKKRRG